MALKHTCTWKRAGAFSRRANCGASTSAPASEANECDQSIMRRQNKRGQATLDSIRRHSALWLTHSLAGVTGGLALILRIARTSARRCLSARGSDKTAIAAPKTSSVKQSCVAPVLQSWVYTLELHCVEVANAKPPSETAEVLMQKSSDWRPEARIK